MNLKQAVYVPGLDIEVPLMELIREIFAENPKYYGLMLAVGGIFIIAVAILIRGNIKDQRSGIFSMLACKPFNLSVFFILLGTLSLAAGITLSILM